MTNEVMLAAGVGLLFGAVLSWPLAIFIVHYRQRRDRLRIVHERRVLGARRTLAQPGTSPSHVKIARVERTTSSSMSPSAERHVGDGGR